MSFFVLEVEAARMSHFIDMQHIAACSLVMRWQRVKKAFRHVEPSWGLGGMIPFPLFLLLSPF